MNIKFKSRIKEQKRKEQIGQAVGPTLHADHEQVCPESHGFIVR